MLTLFSLALFAFGLSAAVGALASPTPGCVAEYCPANFGRRDITPPSTSYVKRTTNAQRLARGLPLNPPTRIRRGKLT